MPIPEKATLLRLHFSEHDRHQGKPLYEAIVDRAKQLGIAGATVFRGLEGYGETAELHRPHLLRHDQPIVVTIIDTAAKIARLIPEIEPLLDTGLIAASEVECIRFQRNAGS
jgi:PII-like signaling protein